MADFAFNLAKGKIGYYGTLPAANDAIKALLLKSSGLEADPTLKDYDTIALLLAGTSDEADASGYARQTLSSVVSTPDDTNEWLSVGSANITFPTVAAGNTLGKLILYYDPDTTADPHDSACIPLTAHDFVATTDGSDIIVTVPTYFYRAS